MTRYQIIELSLLALFAGPAYALAVEVHPVDPAEGGSAPYSVTADGTPIPLERVGVARTVYYARYISPRAADIVISVPGADKLAGKVQPARLVDDLSITAQRVQFRANGDGPRILLLANSGQALPPLFVIAEPPEDNPPKPGHPNVINVRDYEVAPGDSPQTEGLQKALDDCAARPGGGTVYVPPGRYRTAPLHVGSNTYLYLAGGAVLQAVSDPESINVDPGRKEEGGNGVRHSFSRLVLFDGAKHSRLGGRGTLDASGYILRNKHDRRIQVIDAHNCQDLTIEGVVLRNPGSWTLHILHCDGVHVADIKIITDWDVANSDGIDPDSSRNVLMERVFCYCSDDSIAIKATNNSDLLQSVYNIVTRDSVVMTRKTALKVGTETLADMTNILFENIDVVHSSRGAAIWARDGGNISNVIWRDIRMDLHEIPGESRSGQPFYMMAMKREGQSRIENVRLERIAGEAPWYSMIEADTPWPIDDITFDDIKLTITPRTDKKRASHLFEFKHAENIRIHNMEVDWSKASAGHWKGLWDSDAPVVTDNVVERNPIGTP